jgi:hypothetical protein
MKHAECVAASRSGSAAGGGERATARLYRTIDIHAGEHVIAAASPLPDDLRQAPGLIHGH